MRSAFVLAKRRVAFILFGLVWLLAGCASTRIESAWRDPADAGAPPIHKMLVFVVSKDESLRRFAENQAVRSLPAETVGVPSYRLFDKPEPDMAAMRARLVKEGFDGAIIARLVSVDKAQVYHPPEVQWGPPGPWPWGPWGPYSPYHRSFYWYYPYAYSYVTPAYVTESTYVLVETMLYRLPEGKPVWSAVSETVDPKSTLNLVNELVDILGKRLQREGLIASSR